MRFIYGGVPILVTVDHYLPWDPYWNELSMAIMGEYLMSDIKRAHLINGLSISPKKNFCVLKIWNAQCREIGIDLFSNEIPFLDLSGSIYRKHSDSLEADKDKLKAVK